MSSTAEMAMDKDGRFLGLRVDLIADLGAYISQYGPFIPWIGITMSTGVYDMPAIDIERHRRLHQHLSGRCLSRRRAARGGLPDREAGRRSAPATSASAAHEIRRRNFIKPDQFPYRTATGRIYDVGEFDGHLDAALESAGWNDFDKRLAASKKAGKIRGIGLATYIEACAFAGSEPAHVELNGDGTVTLLIGTQTNGQGHATAYAQFVSEKLNIADRPDHAAPGRHRPTSTRAAAPAARARSRSAASRRRAPARTLAEKIKKIAADELEASAADIELVDGTARIVGTDRSIDLRRHRQGGEEAGRSEGLRRVRAERGDLSERHAYLRGRDRPRHRP